MASLGRFLTKLPKTGKPIFARSMGTQAQTDTITGDTVPKAEGGINFVLTETQQEVSTYMLIGSPPIVRFQIVRATIYLEF